MAGQHPQHLVQLQQGGGSVSLSGRDSLLVSHIAATHIGTGKTATEDGGDDIKEYVAASSTDNINTDQPELRRNIFLHQRPDAGGPLDVQDSPLAEIWNLILGKRSR